MTITLTDLITTLEALDPDAPITLDGESGLGVTSWRGLYQEPTIVHCESTLASGWKINSDHGFSFTEETGFHDVPPAETVGELLVALRLLREGAGLCGYKGGVYQASPLASVWADPWGDYRGRGVMGVAMQSGKVALTTAQDPEHAF